MPEEEEKDRTLRRKKELSSCNGDIAFFSFPGLDDAARNRANSSSGERLVGAQAENKPVNALILLPFWFLAALVPDRENHAADPHSAAFLLAPLLLEQEGIFSKK